MFFSCKPLEWKMHWFNAISTFTVILFPHFHPRYMYLWEKPMKTACHLTFAVQHWCNITIIFCFGDMSKSYSGHEANLWNTSYTFSCILVKKNVMMLCDTTFSLTIFLFFLTTDTLSIWICVCHSMDVPGVLQQNIFRNAHSSGMSLDIRVINDEYTWSC